MQNVHITFPIAHFHTMVAAFEEQCAAQRAEVTILDFGCSYKQEVGYIVLAWEDEVDEAFVEHLTADSTVLDFTISCVPDEQCRLLEQVEV